MIEGIAEDGLCHKQQTFRNHAKHETGVVVLAGADTGLT